MTELHIPDDRQFIWRHLEAYLSGQLEGADRARFESIMAACPATRALVQGERRFAAALSAGISQPVAAPDGLRDRILAALDQCDLEETGESADAGAPAWVQPAPRGVVLGFPWLGAAMMAAASVMLVVALGMMFDGSEAAIAPVQEVSTAQDLPRTLSPILAGISLDVPRSERCRYRAAREEYQKHFVDAPDLPREADGSRLRVSHFSCEEVDGKRVMCAVYDSATGERFALVVFKRSCLKGCAPDEMKALEVVVDGKTVVLWRDGEYYRALVGLDAAVLRRHMGVMRKTA